MNLWRTKLTINNMEKDFIVINQSMFNRLKNKMSIASFNSESKLFLSGQSWFELETDSMGNNFRWSRPIAEINYENISGLRIDFMCPIGRKVHIYNNRINTNLTLVPNKLYKLLINVSGTVKLTIETDEFIPEKDTRELGLCFHKISENSTPTLI